MYLKKKEFEAIETALRLLIDYDKLCECERRILLQADISLMNVVRRNKELNRKTAKYIAEKRKIDKNYARPKKKIVSL